MTILVLRTLNLVGIILKRYRSDFFFNFIKLAKLSERGRNLKRL